ncbi:MAG TPA: paraquat-inducible protein A [Vicinamibacterales bacterium]|nr:paraquat-inducible protein A [Vicinamibacterales bacterium]
MTPRRLTVLAFVAVSLAILLPGIFLPVLTIRGVLTPEGIAKMTPVVLEKGLDEETVATLEKLMNPAMLQFLKLTGGDVRKVIIEQLGPRLTAALQQGVGDVEVYTQTRSIVGAVRNLYDVGSPFAATLILLFSVIVPVTKAALVAWAVFMKDAARRLGLLRFVTAIAKWSMADVFVVALFITYLAAQATQTPPGDPNAAPLLSFDATFGPGFYWFAAYCLFSLASQQYSARLARDLREPHS